MNQRRLLLIETSCLLALVGGVASLCAQEAGSLPPPTRPLVRRLHPAPVEPNMVTLPAGTKIPLRLESPITTKTARPGDAVYARTAFPVVVNEQIVIPAGSYVQGAIAQLKRAGRVKGKAEMVVYFQTLIFPSGYTLQLSGAVDNVPGSESGRVKDKEGTIQGDSSKGKDAGTVAKGAEYGSMVGVIAGGVKGAPLTGLAGGGAAGAAVGLATVLLTRGPDIRFEVGSMMETALERPLQVDINRIRPRGMFPVGSGAGWVTPE